MKALILAAGLGTRLRPLTDNKPKALVEIKGVTLLEIAIAKLINAGFNSIIVNVHHFASQITDFLKENNNFGVDIAISDETELLLDTGGAIKKTAEFFKDADSFLVYNVDILSDINLKKMYDTHLASNALVTLAVRNRTTSRYFLFDSNKRLCGWKNTATNELNLSLKPVGKTIPLAFSGIHVIKTDIFPLFPNKEKFSITPTYINLSKKYLIEAYIHDHTSWTDLGKPETLLTANND